VNPLGNKPSLESARNDIRESGLRATPARMATLMLLRESEAPLTHSEVAETLGQSGFDKATAFRNLNDLADAGLLRKTELGDHVWRFEALDPSHTNDAHPHFVCVDCGSVTCLDKVQLTASSLRQSETVGDITEIFLRGHCRICR